MHITSTFIGTATVLFQFGDLTILTDPTLDPAVTPQQFTVPGTDFSFPMVRRTDPGIAAADLPRIDVVLLSHDEHADNFDAAGREVATRAGVVLTTRGGAERLGANAVGLAPGDTYEISGTGVRITATPAQHTTPEFLAVAGEVIGFIIEVDGSDRAIYITGDTLVFPELEAINDRHDVSTMFAHVGRAHFELAGDACFSMSGDDAARLSDLLGVDAVIPIHENDWEHFDLEVAATDLALAGHGAVRIAPGESITLNWPELTPAA